MTVRSGARQHAVQVRAPYRRLLFDPASGSPIYIRSPSCDSATTLRSSRNCRANFRLESRRLRQPCGDPRPRLLDLTLLAQVVVRAFPESSSLGQDTELAFRTRVAFPIVTPYDVIVRPCGGKHPGLDALGRCAPDSPLRTFTLSKPSKNDPSQRVGGVVRRRAGFVTRQVVVRCVPDIAIGVRLTRQHPRLPVRSTRHDSTERKNRTRNRHLPGPPDDSSDRRRPIRHPFYRTAQSQTQQILQAAMSGIQTRR